MRSTQTGFERTIMRMKPRLGLNQNLGFITRQAILPRLWGKNFSRPIYGTCHKTAFIVAAHIPESLRNIAMLLDNAHAFSISQIKPSLIKSARDD